MTSTTLNTTSLRILRDEIDAALADLGTKHGLSITVGRGSYDPDGLRATLRLEIGALSEGGTVVTKERKAYLDMAKLYDMDPEWIDQPCTIAGEVFILTGLSPKAARYPINLKRARDGKAYRYPADTVQRAFLIQQRGAA